MSSVRPIYSERLRELERENAEHSIQLKAGAVMFETIQDSIRMLSQHIGESMQHMGESMQRMENKIDRVDSNVGKLTEQVIELRVKQASHSEQLAELAAKKIEDEEDKRELRKTFRSWALIVGKWAVIISGSALATKFGWNWLASLIKAATGG
jgi:hypothetical protein